MFLRDGLKWLCVVIVVALLQPLGADIYVAVRSLFLNNYGEIYTKIVEKSVDGAAQTAVFGLISSLVVYAVLIYNLVTSKFRNIISFSLFVDILVYPFGSAYIFMIGCRYIIDAIGNEEGFQLYSLIVGSTIVTVSFVAIVICIRRTIGEFK